MPESRNPDEQDPGQPAGRAARANQKRDDGRRSITRSASHVRSAARMLAREANKILERHRARIPQAVVAEIEATVAEIESLRAGPTVGWDLLALECKAEHLDQLLHQHASFARKSALRDSLENIGIAIAVALAVRSCVYEPFKIPSGSMMPTLRAGDHIFVNKFAYGVQVPLTTTIVGEDLISSVARGEVIVFRYPLDESDDFIKRVIGLPGDTIRANQDRRRIEIKRAGSEEFEPIERELLTDVHCLEENSTQSIDNCSVYRETLDDHSYLVRYRDDMRAMDANVRTFVVPEGHLLVMGDNRNASHDSLAWTVITDSIAASGLISRVDVRDLTQQEGRIETRDDESTIVANDDANSDELRYLAERPSPAQGLLLEVWRQPPIDVDATFASLASHYQADQSLTMADLLRDGQGLSDRERERLSALGDEIGTLRYGVHQATTDLIFRAPGRGAGRGAEDPTLFRLHCGRKRCIRRSELAARVARILEAYEANPDYDARELLVREPGRPSTFPGRGKVEERYLERQFAARGEGVRLRVWRKPYEGLAVLRDAALAEYGAGPLASQLAAGGAAEVGEVGDAPEPRPQREAIAVADSEGTLGSDAWIVELERGFVIVDADPDHDMLAVLECGPRRCKTREDALALASTVADRFPTALKQAERMPELLTSVDVGGLPELPVTVPSGYYWDRLEFKGAVFDDSNALLISVLHEPAEGLQAAVDARKLELLGDAAEPVEGLGPSGWYGETTGGHGFVFVIAETELVVALTCRTGMCPDRQTARKLADRAYQKGLDPENFVQKDVSRARPFVPRGNVKGRAEVIWWPTSRFWTKIL